MRGLEQAVLDVDRSDSNRVVYVGIEAVSHDAPDAPATAVSAVPGAVAPSAHLLLSAADEAALFIAHARDPESARAEMGATLEALLGGLAAPGSH